MVHPSNKIHPNDQSCFYESYIRYLPPWPRLATVGMLFFDELIKGKDVVVNTTEVDNQLSHKEA